MVREEQRCRNLKSRLVGLHSVRIPYKMYAKNEKILLEMYKKIAIALKFTLKSPSILQ